MIRQHIKSEGYFQNYLSTYKSHIERGFDMIISGKVLPERMSFFKKGQLDFIFNIVIASYTSGLDFLVIKNEYQKVIDYLNEGWSKNIVNLSDNNKVLNQYTLSGYDQMIWMLSIGYLLDISETEFKKLVELIDRDGVKDFLIEFIIRAKIKGRQPITEESYEHGWGLFGKLRQAITQIDRKKAERLIKEFITKDWYKEHKEAGWYNSHKSKHDTYFGYWSFETAAVVKIMNLDDSSFSDCQYYPKDLVK